MLKINKMASIVKINFLSDIMGKSFSIFGLNQTTFYPWFCLVLELSFYNY